MEKKFPKLEVVDLGWGIFSIAPTFSFLSQKLFLGKLIPQRLSQAKVFNDLSVADNKESIPTRFLWFNVLHSRLCFVSRFYSITGLSC